MGTLYIEYMPVDELAPATVNPKLHDAEGIAASQQRFGYTEPVTIDERTGRLVSGHGRLEGLAIQWSAGMDPPDGIEDHDGRWFVPVTRGWSSANDVEAALLLVAVNQLVAAGGMDDAGLASMMQDMEEQVRSWEGVGFSDDQLADLLERDPAPKYELLVTAATEVARHRLAAMIRDAGGSARYL